MYLLLIFLPLISSFCAGVFGRFLGPIGSSCITVSCLASAFILSIFTFYEVALLNCCVYVKLSPWINSELLNIDWGFMFDSLTVVMCCVVTFVSFIVHLYSTEYMAYDPHIPRFMSYLSLFTFFMVLLVTADNLLVLFVGWEGVGLCSYLLISFWFTRVQANKSAIKAVIMNRIGDMGVMVGLILIFILFKTFNFHIIFPLVPYFYNSQLFLFGSEYNFINITTFCLFIGVIGKSAQIGLHTWLPDAMEGPTPVSALIHAATMVTAGVFLLIRLSSLFEFSPITLLIISFIGGTTSFFAATSGMLQHDIKKVIAYSTCSQLGYMVFICGLSAYNLSIFHLYTHAFFKALLFLSAGTIIHGLSNEQDIRSMGGLIKILPLSYISMLIGSLALIGFPFLSGFYSKDAILETAFSCLEIKGTFTFWLGSFSAISTVFYSIRLIYFIFLEKTNTFLNVFNKCYDMDKLTALVLTILSLGSIFLGFLTKDLFIGYGTQFFIPAIFFLPKNIIFLDAEFIPFYIKIIPTFISIFFSLLVYTLYSNYNIFLNTLKYPNILKSVWFFFLKKWYFDTIYTNKIVYNLLISGYNVSFVLIDKGILEIFGPKGITSGLYKLGKLLISFHTGYIYNYICAIIMFYILVPLYLNFF